MGTGRVVKISDFKLQKGGAQSEIQEKSLQGTGAGVKIKTRIVGGKRGKKSAVEVLDGEKV